MKTMGEKLEEMAKDRGTVRGIFFVAAIIGDYQVFAYDGGRIIIKFEDGSAYDMGDDGVAAS
jgi:hypothetical protein